MISVTATVTQHRKFLLDNSYGEGGEFLTRIRSNRLLAA